MVLFNGSRFGALAAHLPSIVDLMMGSDFLQSDSVEVLEGLLEFTGKLIRSAGPLCHAHRRDLFRILLQLGSVPGTAHLKGHVDQAIDVLARNCSCEDASELFSLELSHMLHSLHESFEQWTAHTPQRFMFDLLCRRARDAVVDYWDMILEIIGVNCDNSKDVELRMDMLGLVEFFLESEHLYDTLVFYGDVFIKGILVPSAVWMVGRPNVKTRKASLICLMKLIERNLIEEDKLYEVLACFLTLD